MDEPGKKVKGGESQIPQQQAASQASAVSPDDGSVGGSADVSVNESAGSRLNQKRRWAIFWALAALVMALGAFWFAINQPATAPKYEPPSGCWAEFFQPSEVNRWQRPQKIITQSDLQAIAFSSDGKTALAAGEAGTLLKSADAGQSWQVVASNSEGYLNSVAFSPDGKSALAAGRAGTLLKSADAGQSWQAVASNSKEDLTSIALSPDGKAALAAGRAGTLLKSADAGQSWEAVGLYSKTPGPWFNALLGLLAVDVMLVARMLLAPGKTLLARLGILSNAVSDKPIDQASEDKLNFYPVVEALSKFLRHPATAPSLSIAINAAWGMGKSSFMNMLAGSLKKKEPSRCTSMCGTTSMKRCFWHPCCKPL